MGRRKLPQTKRDRSLLLQGWFDPANPDEKTIIDAVELIRRRHKGISNKQMIADSIVYAARNDGIAVHRLPSGAELYEMFNRILALSEQMFNMIANGSMSAVDASRLVNSIDTHGMTIDDLDAMSASLGNNYNAFSLNGGDEE